SSLVGPTHRVGPVGAPQYPLAQAKLMEAATEAFAALGTPLPESTRDVSAQVITDVDEQGFVVSRTTRVLLQAMQDTVTEVPCLELVPGTPCPAPIFRAIAGAHVLREYSHPGGEVHGVTFGLEQPLTMAQTALL